MFCKTSSDIAGVVCVQAPSSLLEALEEHLKSMEGQKTTKPKVDKWVGAQSSHSSSRSAQGSNMAC